ncbi:glycoside hydrolase family 99-like domain-containing protein [Patescibacteria group bacterium]|nr:glycoside hydrolase family 99-like domain-containing protein [Patescibacteria group bacterium]MBU4023145.1 glycoside hydrolase family 99-like domain-containing protein [Patescibacteria group bacterium]MBU4078511.1 glycoside hydrolase family 99-like domain-containing protein [Patescibacteria group bacterium]
MLQENLKSQKEKKVGILGAHYYLWYGRPTFPIIGGGVWRSGYTNQPVLGKYNSRHSGVINQHIGWAQEAGIDFFAINWHDSHSWDDITLKDYYLPHKATAEIKFCIHYDSSLALNIFKNPLSYDFNDKYSPNKTKGEKFLEDFEYLADNYFNHPQYLKINGQPIVIIYIARAFKNNSKYFEQLKVNMQKRNISLFLVADVVCWAGVKLTKRNLSYIWDKSPKEVINILCQVINRLFLSKYEDDIYLSKYFKGITGYNMYSVNRTPDFLKNVDKIYQKFYNYGHSNNLHFIPTITPGYDDRNLSGLNRPILGRKDGGFYKDFWEIAEKYIDPSLKMALITSFNEWHEGTEIEPSREYGTKYLKLTRLLKNKN